MVGKKTERWVIKANPGWQVISYFTNNPDPDGNQYHYLQTDQIIAWDISREEGAYDPSANRPGETWTHYWIEPLIVDGHPNDVSNRLWAIKAPDGRIEQPHNQSFENETAFLDYAKTRNQSGKIVVSKK